MVKWAASLADESIVLVEGIAKEVQDPIKSATISNVEVHVSQARITASPLTHFLDIHTAAPNSRSRHSPSFLSGGCQPPGNRV